MRHPPNRSDLMRRAWQLARSGVKRFGGKPRQYLSAALRECWVQAKRRFPARAAHAVGLAIALTIETCSTLDCHDVPQRLAARLIGRVWCVARKMVKSAIRACVSS